MVTNPFFDKKFVTVIFCISFTKFHSKINLKFAAPKRAKNRLWSQLFLTHATTKLHNQSQIILIRKLNKKEPKRARVENDIKIYC